ncbi:hypothetical protein [Streptomyces sp. CB01580]|uniref:hypothetical protein n=1 Tax=Streptomyces sp. CB01580 TaxID=1703933 RepID=UPI000AD6E9CC|nr:hypothetical protein [Streptomyces sp. CB01580]
MRLTGVSKLLALIGGFHLSGPAFEPVIGPTVAALTELVPELIVPGHCTGGRAQHTLAAALPDAWGVPSTPSPQPSRTRGACPAHPRRSPPGRVGADQRRNHLHTQRPTGG